MRYHTEGKGKVIPFIGGTEYDKNALTRNCRRAWNTDFANTIHTPGDMQNGRVGVFRAILDDGKSRETETRHFSGTAR